MKMTEYELTKIRERFPFVYSGDFSSKNDISEQFDIDVALLDKVQIIAANYTYECYSGDAIVLYFDPSDEQYYEVRGGHCSCYGLEGQFEPEVIGTISTFIEYIERVDLRHDKY